MGYWQLQYNNISEEEKVFISNYNNINEEEEEDIKDE